jgi:hypothetical protein
VAVRDRASAEIAQDTFGRDSETRAGAEIPKTGGHSDGSEVEPDTAGSDLGNLPGLPGRSNPALGFDNCVCDSGSPDRTSIGDANWGRICSAHPLRAKQGRAADARGRLKIVWPINAVVAVAALDSEATQHYITGLAAADYH